MLYLITNKEYGVIVYLNVKKPTKVNLLWHETCLLLTLLISILLSEDEQESMDPYLYVIF